jgi:hypothetical protein
VTGLFDSAWLKWGWAVKHGKALDRHITAWRDEHEGDRLFQTHAHYDAKRHCVIYLIDHIEPMPVEWGLMLGDTLNNLRSSLDHVAWAVVKRGKIPKLPKGQAEKVYFPFTKSDRQFSDCLTTKLPGVKLADSALIRRYPDDPTSLHVCGWRQVQGP